ncbi:MAG: hypothetical protein ACLSG4_06630 [Anaerobutyricum sp.]
MKDIKDMKDMETLREKELTKRNKRIQNTISLIRKLNCVIVAIAASLTFFNVWSDYNHYAGSQLVMAEVIDVKGASNENISVTYRYNIAGKEYESNKVQHLKKIKNGDKEEIRVKKDSPEVIFKYNNVIFAIFYDMTLGFCIGLTVVFFRLCEMTNCMLPSDVEEAGVKTYTQNEILKIANKLLADNRKNENADDVDKNPYAAGVHDGILYVLTNLKIDSKEKFLN